jgi:hypothetical protein
MDIHLEGMTEKNPRAALSKWGSGVNVQSYVLMTSWFVTSIIKLVFDSDCH